ncbi:regulatory protein AfsR [Rhizocola hellebori]|uniref:Regulatory protein AfsR n=1 Tax=Rhizocola hellebori TaxID=1392758 RepID=A0A8J3VL82_9ACTN|nr:BTAD domain-containing putative transcriptional regulator [Rhizocola hellebori]GIH10362.1 regulatory protein AfsR [Rhizocola hellebori]
MLDDLDGEMRIGLLGPLEVTVGGRAVAIVRRRERCLFAVLALAANRIVPVSRLIGLLWETEPPAAAHRSLQSHVSRLRSLLAATEGGAHPVRLLSHDGGYSLQVPADSIDAHRFRDMVAMAATLPPAQRSAQLKAALGLWRGELLDGCGSAELRFRLAADLEDLRLTAMEDWAEAELALGRPRQLIPQLTGVTDAHPSRERLVQLHMLALHQAGRPTDALELYERTRLHLSEHYGVDPGLQLRQTQLAVLRDDVAELADTARLDQAPVRSVPATPAQLPPPIAALIGRESQRQMITRALIGLHARGAAPAIIAVHGPGGVGKSALALVSAHEVADQFPDGQLYVDLQGATMVVSPLRPEDVVGRFLRALGVPAAQVPVDAGEAEGLYRTLLSQRRVLIVADNAADAAQVLPLFPASPRSAIIVTSRRVLAAVDATVQIGLGPLSATDAEFLLGLTAGAAKAVADPAAVAAVAKACGYLPLALRVAGARLVARDDWSFGDLAQRLTTEHHVLRELADSEDTLRNSLSVSWRALSASTDAVDAMASRLLPALAVVQVADVDAGLAGALLGLTAEPAELALDRLTEARLVEVAHGRYRMHDVVRLFATELASQLGPAVRGQLLGAALDWYRRGALQANRLMRGDNHIRFLPEPQGQPGPALADAGEAGTWLDVERANLLTVTRQALAGTGQQGRDAGQLVMALYPGLISRGHAYEYEMLCRSVLSRADRLDEPKTVAATAKNLAVLYRLQVRTDEALHCLDQAYDLSQSIGDRYGEASAIEVRGMIHVTQGDSERAFADLQTAVQMRRELDDPGGEGVALCNLAEAHFRFGQPERSLEFLQASLAIRRERANPAGEAITLANIAEVQLKIGRTLDALESTEASLARSQQSAERLNEGRTRSLRAKILLQLGRIDEAVKECEEALRLAEASGAVIDVGHIHDILAELETAGAKDYVAAAGQRLRQLGSA